MSEIIYVCAHTAGPSSTAEIITMQQVKKAVEFLNRGKAADMYVLWQNMSSMVAAYSYKC